MFDGLEAVVQAERERLRKQSIWLTKFNSLIKDLPDLSEPWKEKQLVNDVKDRITPITKIAGVDGGVVAEAMSGFDIVLYRAVASVFQGIGEKVHASYIPNFDPDPRLFLSPSLPSRQEFNSLSTLLRLLVEYEIAIETVDRENPTVIFIDGKVTPLTSDFSANNQNAKLVQAEIDVKAKYRELVEISCKNHNGFFTQMDKRKTSFI
ncbi:MAG: DNA double-strand break repair nuclease NurA [Candidatus Kariarchaeaceae archaeon]|jgi:hypothetical protein